MQFHFYSKLFLFLSLPTQPQSNISTEAVISSEANWMQAETIYKQLARWAGAPNIPEIVVNFVIMGLSFTG